MAIFVNDAQLRKELNSLGIDIIADASDFSIIEKYCILAIINLKEVDWPSNSIIDLIGRLNKIHIFTMIIIDPMNKIMIDRFNLHKLDGILISEEQFRWLIGIHKDRNILTIVQEISERLQEISENPSAIRKEIRNDVRLVFKKSLNLIEKS